MLRNQLGEDLYRRSIKTYLESHALSSVVTDDLRQVIEQQSGRPMDRFFDQWVYHARHPDVKVTYRWLPKEELAHVKVTQTHNVDNAVLLFHFPTTLRFIADGQTVNQAVEISDKEHDFYVPLAAQPTIVRFDPELTVLADVTFDKPDEMLFAQLEYPQDMIGRLLAAEALGKRKTKKAVDALRKSLNGDPFFGVRIAASGSLREIHNDDAFAALRDSREQPDARVRQQVVADLSRFFREETLEVLEQVVATEHNPAIQASAIQGLGRFHGPRARKVIKQYLKSNSFRNELAGAAIRAIRMQDDAAYGPALLSTLRRRESDFTSRGFGQGLEALAHVNRKEEEKDRVREFLVGFLNHPQRSVQRSAISALGTLADPKALAVLQPLARDVGDPVLSRAARSAVEALEQNKPATPAELVELRKIVTELIAGNEELR
jgi:aminopeptidase N